VFSEQEKNFLRKAFTTYLSSDVVDEIVNDPSRLKLGGQEKMITALFTDIKSFSTLSEKVTPEHLVHILNKYLTKMSDLVLEQKGTIDKYIGDAIVAFFGAPIDLPDHASRACLAAVRMKQAEKLLNEEMLANNETPSPIYTRIGVNTGPMVVGNMGTENKMNYTIMGNDVNLAARLEGVNKSYGTWILVSESTWNATNGMFLGRKLDRVRVVGINTPVQLYNILAVRSEADEKMVALVAMFDKAIDAYRERRIEDALGLFAKCREIDSDDAASGIFHERVKNLLMEGVPENWSDVINMTSK
jgi:adenylate cyclase